MSLKYFIFGIKILTNINERMPCAPIPEAANNKRPFMSFAYINTIKLMVWCHETERDIAHQCLSARLIAFDAHMCKKLNARIIFARNATGPRRVRLEIKLLGSSFIFYPNFFS